MLPCITEMLNTDSVDRVRQCQYVVCISTFFFSILKMSYTLLCWSRKPELRCRLSKGCINLGKPQGVGVSKCETDGEQMGSCWEGMEMGRSVYEQPGTRVDRSYRSKEGFQVSKGIKKGSKRGSAREMTSKGKAPMYISRMYT